MKTTDVVVVRIYLTEATSHLEHLLKFLHDESKVCGVTVFRGITGFGKSGRVHSSFLLDVSLDLPVVVEFFDRPAKVEEILKRLDTMMEPGHVLSWPARVNVSDNQTSQD